MLDGKKINNSNQVDILKSNIIEKPVFSISKQENFDIEKIKGVSESYNYLNKKAELELYRKFEEKNNNDKALKQEIFSNNDNDLLLSLIPSKPEKREEINLSDAFANSASFEINVDLLNHVTNSGGMEKLNFQFLKKD